MKNLLIVFFLFHLGLIFFQGLNTTLNGYWRYHYDDNLNIPIISLIKQNNYTDPYYILTGINTGYGFYGIKTSSEKFIRLTYFDSLEQTISFDRYFGLKTSNGISRLNGYASYLSNYIADTEKLKQNDSSLTVNNSDIFKYRVEYVTKSLKWLGRNKYLEIPENADSYKIQILTLIPQDLHTDKKRKKPELYVIQEALYPIQ